MICPTCNQQIPDDSAFCPACGANFAPQQPAYDPAPAYQPAPAAKKAPNKKLLGLVAIVLVAVIALGAVFFLFGGASGAAGVAQDYAELQMDRFELQNAEDFDEDAYKDFLEASYELYPQFYIDRQLKSADVSNLEEFIEKQVKSIKEFYKENKDEKEKDAPEYSFDIIDIIVEKTYNDETNKSQYRDYLKGFKETFDLKESEVEEITEMAKVCLVVSSSYEKDGEGEVIDVETDTVYCINYDGNWYMVDSFPTVSEDEQESEYDY